MNRHFSGLCLLMVAATFHATAALSQARPRLIQSESGSRGTEQGSRFVIEDPRTAFYYPEDQQIIVWFEWEGRPGHHHFEGRWKNPSGKVVVVSELEYESPGSSFGAYWTLQLNDNLTPGMWALEAVVDGVSAGMHGFQVLASADSDLTQPGRSQLTPAQLYARLQSASATVHRLDADGRKIGTGSGFVVPGGRLLTTFAIIDGAARIRVAFADGRTAELDHVVTWDRRGDWALLAQALETEPLELAPEGIGEIGDRCYSLNVPFEGSRVLAEGQVVGHQDFPEVGERLSVSFVLTAAAYGSPVVNGYGEVIGLAVFPGTWPGAASLSSLRLIDGPPLRQSMVGIVAGRNIGPSAESPFRGARGFELYSRDPHHSVYFSNLPNYPPFQELVRPK